MALPPPKDSSTCLVTGASAGIGTEFARQLAALGYNVTLVARRKERLEELAEELTAQHGVKAKTIACDLSSAAARGRMITTVKRQQLDVDVLVNNAGFGTAARFQDLETDGELGLVRTNVEAVVHLCSVFVESMVERGRGAVLNVASTASFQPLPRQASYAASKAFVLSFTEALGEDLHGTGVKCTALCPGPVPTEFADVAGIDEKFVQIPGVATSPADTAAAGIEGMERGKRVVIPGAANRAGALAGRLAPHTVALPMLRRFYPVGK
jgi:short-subunit dehydrogenase